MGSLTPQADIEIGDPVFDQRVAIDAVDPMAVARFLSPTRHC